MEGMDALSDLELAGKSKEIDRYDYEHPTEADYTVSYVLYRAPDGRHFRYVEASSFKSEFAGAQHFVDEWLEGDAVTKWKPIVYELSPSAG